MAILFLEIESFCRKSAALNFQIYKSPERKKEDFWRVPIRDFEGNYNVPEILAIRATKMSFAQRHKIRYHVKAYEILPKLNASSTPVTQDTSSSVERRWPSQFLWLSKYILFIKFLLLFWNFWLSCGNRSTKCAW